MKHFLPAIGWGLFVLILSTMPSVSLPETFWDLLGPDKIAHLIVYGIFTLLIVKGFHAQNNLNKKNIAIAVIVPSLFGILMEIIQYSFFPDRYFEIYDIIANIIGSFVSLFFIYSTEH